MKGLVKRITTLLVVASISSLAGCSDSKVVLQGTNGGKMLTYDSKNFHPQVETSDDLAILVQAAAQTMKDAADDKSVVTVEEISDALHADDWRRLERIVVEYRAAHRR
jgi:hypothetical protein